MSRSAGHRSSLGDALGDATNVLLLVPSMAAGGDEACTRLLSSDAAGDEHVLCISLSSSPDDRLSAWRQHNDADRPPSVGFVDVGDPTRSTAAAGGGSIEVPGEDTVIETVSSPADLTGIGIKVSRFLSRWDGDGGRIVVCFHTLTTLLQYVDLQEAFRFLHVLTGRLGAVGAFGHYHMDPTAHDQRTVNTLKSLFDAVVEVDEDGEWSVTTR